MLYEIERNYEQMNFTLAFNDGCDGNIFTPVHFFQRLADLASLFSVRWQDHNFWRIHFVFDD